MKELVEYIARCIVSAPDDVKVTEETDAGGVVIKLEVNAEDKGRVIGKQGRARGCHQSRYQGQARDYLDYKLAKSQYRPEDRYWLLFFIGRHSARGVCSLASCGASRRRAVGR
jgi:hypothetical protein